MHLSHMDSSLLRRLFVLLFLIEFPDVTLCLVAFTRAFSLALRALCFSVSLVQ